ncbi:hypothetical protein GNX18_12580 [Microbulbifer sp. SH-1]|uniref:hypothetical protein n=1 Tax=Microbulbifer sp. SH-1 TaxID=2681547 RepID=UPI00140B59C0|nr:hypothetical protein [Microbulbifer sp. SH-1]QIL90500.1 hypothetical protein GNX18_12580 [Microbulbifer sp. SH-1]
MKLKLTFTLLFSASVLVAGCASQEDMLHADLWSGDPSSYEIKAAESVQDLGKTPRDKMLEQRREADREKSKSTKDNLIGYLVLGGG